MDFEIYGIGAVALAIAIVQFAKMLGLPAKFAPVLAVVVGVVEGFVVFGTIDPMKSVVLGLVAGFSAVGIWSGVKNVVEGIEDDAQGN